MVGTGNLEWEPSLYKKIIDLSLDCLIIYWKYNLQLEGQVELVKMIMDSL